MEVQKKNIVKIKIFGTNFTLKTDVEKQYVKKIADTINKRMNTISENNLDLPSFKIAVLCLIEIMDEMFKAKEQLNEIENELSTKTTDLIKRIEERLSADYTLV